jgi:hypothetical protein
MRRKACYELRDLQRTVVLQNLGEISPKVLDVRSWNGFSLYGGATVYDVEARDTRINAGEGTVYVLEVNH